VQFIDEFEDVTWSENQFFKLWNRFVRRHRRLTFADYIFPQACQRFARDWGPKVLRLGLRNAFLLHMLAMWEWGLITPQQIAGCMMLLDQRSPPSALLMCPLMPDVTHVQPSVPPPIVAPSSGSAVAASAGGGANAVAAGSLAQSQFTAPVSRLTRQHQQLNGSPPPTASRKRPSSALMQRPVTSDDDSEAAKQGVVEEAEADDGDDDDGDEHSEEDDDGEDDDDEEGDQEEEEDDDDDNDDGDDDDVGPDQHHQQRGRGGPVWPTQRPGMIARRRASAAPAADHPAESDSSAARSTRSQLALQQRRSGTSPAAVSHSDAGASAGRRVHSTSTPASAHGGSPRQQSAPTAMVGVAERSSAPRDGNEQLSHKRQRVQRSAYAQAHARPAAQPVPESESEQDSDADDQADEEQEQEEEDDDDEDEQEEQEEDGDGDGDGSGAEMTVEHGRPGHVQHRRTSRGAASSNSKAEVRQ